MRNRAWQAFTNSQKKVKISEDLVSGLADDILVNIISRLPVREAARTSVLSQRWRYLWTFITNLDFEPPRLASMGGKTITQRNRERSEYINWVNKALELHSGLSVNGFRINFDLVDSDGSSITNWIYMAISKGVEKFELNLPRVWYRTRFCKPYTFPQDVYNRLKNPCDFPGIKSLRSLCLSGVEVSEDILEFFIHACSLDRLRVASLLNLYRVKVIGSSVRLKHLDIDNCPIQEVEISAPSLVSFKYDRCDGRKIDLKIEKVPQLVDLSIDGYTFSSQIVSYYPQLKNLKLGLPLDEIYEELSQCELPKLRHLSLNVSPCNSDGLLFLTRVIKKCPFLQKLTLKLEYFFPQGETEIRQIPKYPLLHLKVLELLEFSGNEREFEIVSYILENAAILEKAIVKCRVHIRITEKRDKLLPRKSAREWHKLLKPMLPQRVKLRVL